MNLNDLIMWLVKNETAFSLTISTCDSTCAEEVARKVVRNWDYLLPRWGVDRAVGWSR